MIIRPFEELEAMARARYKARYASVPEPKVINVDALVQFHAPRTFEWGGVGLRAPPLSFVAGVRLLVAANALRDLRTSNAPTGFIQAAVQTAAYLIRQNVFPIKRRHRLGWRFPRSFAWWFTRLFADDSEMVEGLLRWLLHVPDEAPSTPPTQQVTLDFMDSLAGFVREFPRWVGADGFPISWAAYVYGSRHMGRVHAREDVRHAMSVRAGGADQKDYTKWNREVCQVAGWPHG